MRQEFFGWVLAHYAVRWLLRQGADNSLLALRGPILVNGQFGALAVRPDLKSVAARGGAATVLGVVATPFAALIPFVELGNAKDTDCAPLVARARQFIDQSPADGSRGGHRVS